MSDTWVVYTSTARPCGGYGGYINVYALKLNPTYLTIARLKGERVDYTARLSKKVMEIRTFASRVYGGHMVKSKGAKALARCKAWVQQQNVKGE